MTASEAAANATRAAVAKAEQKSALDAAGRANAERRAGEVAAAAVASNSRLKSSLGWSKTRVRD